MIIEIVRIIVISLVGAIFAFLLQPWLYRSGIIPLTDVDPEVWVGDRYTVGVAIVFSVCIISTLLWYVLTSKAKVARPEDRSFWRLMWWLFLLLPIISICVALYFFNGSNDALLSLTGFYILNALICFWLTTALNTPGALMYAAPGSSLRLLLGN